MNVVTSQAGVPLLVWCIFTPLLAQTSHPRIPPRVAEEAEILEQYATRIMTEESLEERSLMPPSRFRPRAGSAAEQAIGPRFRIRQVVSEFSFGALRTSRTPDLVEFRQVLSVDGQPQPLPDSAVRTLAEGIQMGDDRARKRMLEQFARTGLVDFATDYALILLAFTSYAQKQIEFVTGGPCYIGPDPAISLTWKQISPQGGVTEFHGGQSTHRPLQGTLWLRASDGLPLRISAWTEYTEYTDQADLIRDDVTVDYILSEHGFLTPASVIHHHVVNGTIVTENLYRYRPFKLFATSSTITFGTPK
jgi:hypothetical protein